MKNFVCVKYADGTNDVVPKGWLVGTDACKWPPEICNVQDLTKKEVVAEEEWCTCPCIVLFQASIYDRCIKKGYTQSNLEDSDSDISIEEEPHQLKISPLIRTDSSQKINTFKRPLPPNQRPLNGNEYKSLIAKMERMDDKLETIVEILKQKVVCAAVTETIFPEPADNEKDLVELITQINDKKRIGKVIDMDGLQGTLRNFIKLFMTKNLALKFSWSGLGCGRKQTKISFKTHPLFAFFIDVLPYTRHNGASHQEIATAVKRVLPGVGDWDGGHVKRVKIQQPNENPGVDTDSCDDA